MRNPWEINPLLLQEHLVELAKFIADIRGEVVDLYDPNGVGDTKRGLGLRVYECIRNRLIRETCSKRKPWLGIVNPEGRFTFSINGVPVRFYRGEPETPEERRFIPSSAALQQQSLLPLSESEAAILWFFVVEADSEQYADKVTFCGFDSETHEQVSSWEVPMTGSVTSKPAPVGEKVEPVAKPEVKVKLKAKPADQRKNA